jgi:hypothetical protein
MEALRSQAIRMGYMSVDEDDVHVTAHGKLLFSSLVFVLLVGVYIVNTIALTLFSKTYRYVFESDSICSS